MSRTDVRQAPDLTYSEDWNCMLVSWAFQMHHSTPHSTSVLHPKWLTYVKSRNVRIACLPVWISRVGRRELFYFQYVKSITQPRQKVFSHCTERWIRTSLIAGCTNSITLRCSNSFHGINRCHESMQQLTIINSWYLLLTRCKTNVNYCAHSTHISSHSIQEGQMQ